MVQQSNGDETMGLREYARYRGFAPSTAIKLKNRGEIFLNAEGRVKVKASDASLAMRPQKYKGGTTKRDLPPQPEPPSYEMVVGAHAALTAVIKNTEAFIALSAIKAGASCTIAYAAAKIALGTIVVLAGDIMSEMGGYDPDDIELWDLQNPRTKVHWPKVAAGQGEPYDPEAWERHLAEVDASDAEDEVDGRS